MLSGYSRLYVKTGVAADLRFREADTMTLGHFASSIIMLHPEYWGSKFFQKDHKHLPDFTAPKTRNS
jgi:hypothetical protein